MKKIYPILLASLVLTLSMAFSSFSAEKADQQENTGKIAFCQHDGRYWQIWVMDLDGANRKQLTDSPVDKRSPDFSGDGKRIVYVTNEGRLWVMDSDGSKNTLIPLKVSAAEPRWCFIDLSTSKNKSVEVNTAFSRGEERSNTSLPSVFGKEKASKDKKIIFTSYRGISFLDDSDVWLVDADGSHLEKIIRRPSIQFLPQVSDSGEEIVFTDVLESVGHEIFKYDLKTKDYTQLTQNSSHDTAPVFVLDGEKVLYTSDEDGNYDIWIMDKFGQHQKNLTHRPAFDSSPAAGQDGKAIFFLSDAKNGMQIWSMDIDGKDLRLITDDASDKQDISVYTKR